MPTVMRVGRYRFFFYTNEGNDAGDQNAKFWLGPVTLATNHGFRARELNEISTIVAENELRFVEVWDDFFGRG